MLEVYANIYLRGSIVLLVVIFAFVRKLNGIDIYLAAYLFNAVLADIATLIWPHNNLVPLTILGFIQLHIVISMIVQDTKYNRLHLIGVPIIALFLFYLNSNFYFFQSVVPLHPRWKDLVLNVQQFFDMFSVINFIIIVLLLYWLHHLVSDEKIDFLKDRPSTLIVWFVFTTYYAGSFFVVAFGRLLLPSQQDWVELWETIYIPIHIFFLTVTSIKLLWKKPNS